MGDLAEKNTRISQKKENRTLKNRGPWPTKAAMKQVYDQHLWGGTDYDYFSGDGSHNPSIVEPYVSAVNTFLNSFKEPMVVCDLGCGDFNVGRHHLPYSKNYIAIDIVPDLIERNKGLFKDPKLEFQCLDISKDKLPRADCAIVRQVFQHLSNAEINQTIKRLKSFKFIILTEHVPGGEFVPNKDTISGQGTRLKINSGVDLREEPFNLNVKTVDHLLSADSGSHGGILKTELYSL